MAYTQSTGTFPDLWEVFSWQPPVHVFPKFLMAFSSVFSCNSCCVYLLSMLDSLVWMLFKSSTDSFKYWHFPALSQSGVILQCDGTGARYLCRVYEVKLMCSWRWSTYFPLCHKTELELLHCHQHISTYKRNNDIISW